MKTLPIVLAATATLLLSSCATSGGSTKADSKPETVEVANPIRLALQPVDIPQELEGCAAPAVFEQTLCNRLFELNKKQVMCADEVKVFIENKRQGLVLGSGEDTSMDAVLASLDAPRHVNLIAAKAGEAVAMTILVQDKAGKTLDRFQMNLKADGADVFERANEAAVRIVKIPGEAPKP
ncbi:MAG: hypothetical protein QM765_02155 [Myxococcales bacterium]